MLDFFEPLRQMTLISVCLRMVFAALCGGLIGIEREYKRRPAGFRTHILICLGAAMTTLTGQYLSLVMHYPTDMTRLGAQVIAGVGFIGAGTIIVTGQQRVKGLTTAAGLWTVAIVGLTLGSGFYEAAFLTTALVLLAELLLSKLEYRLRSLSPEVNVYIEYREKGCLEQMTRLFRQRGVKVLNMEIMRTPGGESGSACAIFLLRLGSGTKLEALLRDMDCVAGATSVRQL